LHDGEPLHVLVAGIEESWGDEGERRGASFKSVTYVATGVPLDDELMETYEDAFYDVARGYFAD
jgi:hypothetical protein